MNINSQKLLSAAFCSIATVADAAAVYSIPWNGAGGTASCAFSGCGGASPDPFTSAMMILGFASVGFMAYRRKSKVASTAA